MPSVAAKFEVAPPGVAGPLLVEQVWDCTEAVKLEGLPFRVEEAICEGAFEHVVALRFKRTPAEVRIGLVGTLGCDEIQVKTLARMVGIVAGWDAPRDVAIL